MSYLGQVVKLLPPRLKVKKCCLFPTLFLNLNGKEQVTALLKSLTSKHMALVSLSKKVQEVLGLGENSALNKVCHYKNYSKRSTWVR